MNIVKILIISLSLAADAFAVAICKGINTKEFNYKKCIKVGIYFGLFQAIMPVLGYTLGTSVRDIFFFIGHYVVFFFLVVIGVSMLYEVFCGEEKIVTNDYSFVSMIMSAFATSIDAFSVGITFAFLKVNLLSSILVIGIITFLLSAIGVYIGNKFGRDDSKKAKLLGGIILIIMAIELLIEHIL